MEFNKDWWKSRTIWAAFAALVAAILVAIGVIPEEQVDALQLTVIAVIGYFLRLGSGIAIK